MNARLTLLAGVCALAVASLGQSQASVVSFQSGAALSATPLSITLGTGANFLFTAASTGNGPGAAVQSAGSNKVTSFFGDVADFGAGSSIDQFGQLYTFTTFTPAVTIPNSPADDFIGLSFTLTDGVHYGYAEVAGASLVSYAYDTAPNTSILTGAVPEPASIALLLVGAAGIVATRLRRNI